MCQAGKVFGKWFTETCLAVERRWVGGEPGASALDAVFYLSHPLYSRGQDRCEVLASEFWWKVEQQVDRGPGGEVGCVAGNPDSSVGCMFVCEKLSPV